MIYDFDYPNRQLLPRWVPFLDSNLYYPQSTPEKKMDEFEIMNFTDTINEWDKKPTFSLAGEIISKSHFYKITDTPSYKEAVDFVLSEEGYLQHNPFISNILGEKQREGDYKRISKLKKEISYNFSPSLYVDLAYYYEILGQSKIADKAIQIACYLHPDNAFLLRSISRFFLLRKDIEKALYILTSNSNVQENPLIISAEISISEAFNCKSKLLRKGHILTKNESISNIYENELFATFGTLEFNNGNSKKGKKLINQALLAPNENIIAQARYLSAKFQKEIDLNTQRVPNRYEADTWIAYNQKDFSSVITQSEKWFYFQPFSASPAIMNSYINSLVFGNEKDSIKMAKQALKISKDDFSLQNNLVVAACRDNQIEMANIEFKKLKSFSIKEDINKEILLATSGLLDYRNGYFEIGRKKYEEAIQHFEKIKDSEKLARCLYYFGCEAKNAREHDYVNIILKAKSLANQNNYQDILTAINRNFSEIK